MLPVGRVSDTQAAVVADVAISRKNRIAAYDAQMLSLIVSTIAYFVAAHYINRWLDEMQVPKGFTRSVVVVCAALIVAYAVAIGVDWLASMSE